MSMNENMGDLQLDLFLNLGGHISIHNRTMPDAMDISRTQSVAAVVESKARTDVRSSGSPRRSLARRRVERWAFSSEIAHTHGTTSRISRQSHSRRERIQNPARPGRIDCRRSCGGSEGIGRRSCRQDSSLDHRTRRHRRSRLRQKSQRMCARTLSGCWR